MPGAARSLGALASLIEASASYARLAWWGICAPRLSESRPLVVAQGIVMGSQGVLLAVRSDLRGWELPGGTVEPGESPEVGLRREVREETGLEVVVGRHVGDYVRSGFRPHTAKVYLCGVSSETLEPGEETRRLQWFPPEALPDTLFPWYRVPLDDAWSAGKSPVTRHNRQGLVDIWAGLRIDLRTRLRDAGREGR